MSIAEHPPLDFPKLAAGRSRIRRIQASWPLVLRGLETLALVCMWLWLVQSRLALGEVCLFRYSDEDQTLLWHASHDLVQGRIPEPAFYGQSFNSCLEGYLAAPLIGIHVLPYWVAVPSVSMVLGLFPFLAMAWVAWRRGRFGLAALALAVPLAMPVRYAMLTGMPRGFVIGIAVAIIPCLLLLKTDASPGIAKTPAKWRKTVRCLLIGLLAVVALTLNPNCSLMIAGALVYAIATRWREAAFWLYSSIGAFVGALYPLGLFVFYFKLHDDYRLYHREEQYDWTAYGFQQFWHHLNIPLGDFLPVGLEAASTSRQEILELRRMVARDLADAEARNISPDARYNMAYSAARTSATIIIRASGYRIRSGDGAHHMTFGAIAEAEPMFGDAADYFDRCRRKRNELLYHAAGGVSSGATEALIRQATQFQVALERWLKEQKPSLY